MAERNLWQTAADSHDNSTITTVVNVKTKENIYRGECNSLLRRSKLSFIHSFIDCENKHEVRDVKRQHSHKDVHTFTFVPFNLTNTSHISMDILGLCIHFKSFRLTNWSLSNDWQELWCCNALKWCFRFRLYVHDCENNTHLCELIWLWWSHKTLVRVISDRVWNLSLTRMPFTTVIFSFSSDSNDTLRVLLLAPMVTPQPVSHLHVIITHSGHFTGQFTGVLARCMQTGPARRWIGRLALP